MSRISLEPKVITDFGVLYDPFGGSGTTYAVCEQKARHWIGIEIGEIESIRDRLNGSV